MSCFEKVMFYFLLVFLARSTEINGWWIAKSGVSKKLRIIDPKLQCALFLYKETEVERGNKIKTNIVCVCMMYKVFVSHKWSSYL